MGNLSVCCPYCGGYMLYIYSEDINICDTCCYIIRSDGTEDFSNMDLEDE